MAVGNKYTIADFTHPAYGRGMQDWQKWRLTYDGGSNFINYYLKRLSRRESNEDFEDRKKMSYNPAFAKEAINEIKNSLFQRFIDISREGGSVSYQEAIRGLNYGVDLLGSSLNAFLGTQVLPELLVMSKVGVFIDMPQLSGITIAENLNKRPYMYCYRVEDIRTWRFDQFNSQTEYSALLLRDYIFEYDNDSGLPIGETCRFRHMWVDMEKGGVWVKYYDLAGNDLVTTSEYPNPQWLDIPRIPFVVIELNDSLMKDVADYQIALLNLASSDISYSLKCNFPFYTEQIDSKTTTPFIKKEGEENSQGNKSEIITVGTTQGRRYPKGLDRPQFINPSAEPLKASMAKQEQLKTEIRQIVQLSVQNLQAGASAESKQVDNQGLENGLSYIGLTLENAERKIAQYWAMYEKSEPATIHYPEKYSIRSEEDRRAEADELSELLERVPSPTCQKEISKRIAEVLLGNKTSLDTMEKIRSEIDKAPGITSDPTVIVADVTAGICDLATAETLRGYPKGTAEKASQDHADRLARIAESQAAKSGDAAARGVTDLDDDPSSGKKEKKDSLDTTQDDTVKKKQRGQGKADPQPDTIRKQEAASGEAVS